MIRLVGRSASLLETFNLLLRFVLELCAAGAVAYWGFASSDSLAVALLLALAGGGVVALVWGAFVAPKAPRRLADPARLGLELFIFAGAAVGLVATGSAVLGLALGIAVVLNLSLMFLLGQRGL